MARMIQVRNVPDRLHRELKRRARSRGQTLTAYVEEILKREASTPLPEEVYARIRRREPVEISPEEIAATIRQDRGRLPGS
jgi:plasmid stability protein